MKAIVWTNYGAPDVLQLRDVEKPVPADNEVLIRVQASTVTIGDCELRALNFPILFQLPARMYIGFIKPKRITILGQELSGEIEAVGKTVSRFKPGDQVSAWTGFRLGAYAEYACLPAGEMVALKPANMTYAEAATLPVGGLEAMHFLRPGTIQSGQKVLINGAGGSIGSYAIQLAKYFGAEVTAVDSAEKLAMLHAAGADTVIDYAQADFTRQGKTYDVIFDVIGKSPFSRSLKSLAPNGFYLLGNPGLSQRIQTGWASPLSSQKIIPYSARTASEIKHDTIFLKELVEAGKIKAIIDRRYPLEQTAEAHRYVGAGHKKGNVVITIGQSADT